MRYHSALKKDHATKFSNLPLLACAAMMISQAQAQTAFNRTLTLQGVSFHVICANEGSENTLRIAPSGAPHAPRAIEQKIEGSVVGAEVADLDGNGAPEIYVFVQSAGSGSYGTVVSHAVHHASDMAVITMPEMADDPKLSASYMGRARFSIVGKRLLRQFPIYREGDPNAMPSGGTRQVQYRLVTHPAGLRLQPVEGETRDMR